MEAEEEKDVVMSDIHLGCPPGAESHFTRFTISPSVLPYPNPLTARKCHFSLPGVALLSVRVAEAMGGNHFQSRIKKPFVLTEGDLEQNTNSNIFSNKEASTCQQFIVDKEGDLVLARRKNNQKIVRYAHDSILIHHHITTTIPNVGLQIWRASLVLADFVLHSINTFTYFNNVVALELGAGTGLVGILLACAARTVFITDKGIDILDNCSRNVELNLHTYKHKKSVQVRQLDWQEQWPPKEIQTREFLTSCKNKYSWTSSDIEEAEAASVLLAADVVYSDELTDAFFKVLRELIPLGSKKVMFLSLEKRYNFTMEDLDIVAHGYQHFRTFFAEDVPESTTTGFARDQPARRESGITNPHFIGKRIDTASIPQYIKEYDRGGDTELWEIRAQPYESII